jgi:hypothetical protein
MLAVTCAWAQQQPSAQKQSAASADFALTYTTERGQLTSPNGGSFWIQGGGADAAVTLWKGLGIAGSVVGGHASNIAPGVDLNKIEFTAGPRYTYTLRTGHPGAADQRRLQLFGQGLIGGVRAFDGVFPAGSAASTSAASYAVDAGGGLNLFFSNRLGVRLVEADYVRTALPNNGSNVQNDLRLSAGIVYHFGKR